MSGVSGGTRARGFTLLEILVVLVIVSIVVAAISLEIRATSRVTAGDQAGRIASLMRALRVQAVTTDDDYGVRFGRDGYGFVRRGPDGHWHAITHDHLFRQRHFPQGVQVSVSIAGASGPLAADQRDSRIVEVGPDGHLSAFRLTVSDGDGRYVVAGKVDGDVSVQPAA